MQEPRMQGSHPGHLPPPSKTHGTGRVCEASGCETRLSVYNPKRRCWQHTDITFPTYRGKRLQPGNA
jgi:hypothetical protein